jgi:hypothetical protein
MITMSSDLDRRDAERLDLLDRIANRVPGLDLNQHAIEWQVMPDGAEVLPVDGGSLDGGEGYYFESKGDDLLAFGSLAPIIEGGWGVC